MSLKPRTHDYTRRGWGHDYTFTPLNVDGKTAEMIGWGEGIRPLDYLILQNGDDRTTRYQVADIRYFEDPEDMWRATVVFAPRTRAVRSNTDRLA